MALTKTIIFKGGAIMDIGSNVTNSRDIEDAKKISEIFADISEESKTMAIVYISALRDKEIADSGKQIELQEV